MKRNTLLVGSLPYLSEKEAMENALSILQDSLVSLPDGEVGEVNEAFPQGKREAWVMTAIENMIESGAFEVVKDKNKDPETGHPADYKSLYKLKPLAPPDKIADKLDFGYAAYSKESYEDFKKLRKKAKRPELKFQVGVPTGLAIALATLSMPKALRYRKVFDDRLAEEVRQIVDIAGDDVVIQIEVVFEVKLADTLPGFLMNLPVNAVIELAKKMPPGASYGIHLCLGDLKNKAFVHLTGKTVSLLVTLGNKLSEKWPYSNRPLTYIHYPLAEGDVAPPVDERVYRELHNVELPEGTRFIAGCVHEGLSEDDNKKVLEMVEEAKGNPVDVAASCGLGRRDRETAELLMKRMAELATFSYPESKGSIKSRLVPSV